MFSNNEGRSEISFSKLDESVLELMKMCVQQSETKEKANDDAVGEEVKNISSDVDDIGTLETLIERKQKKIKEYQEEIRILRTRVEGLKQANNKNHEVMVSEKKLKTIFPRKIKSLLN